MAILVYCLLANYEFDPRILKFVKSCEHYQFKKSFSFLQKKFGHFTAVDLTCTKKIKSIGK
jgi:hypothetical protein